MKVLIVTHVSNLIGLGHLSRSLVVARALRDEIGAKVHLMIQGPRIERQDLAAFPHDFIDPSEDLSVTAHRKLIEHPCQAVVFDLQKAHRPHGLAALLDDLRQRNLALAGIDDAIDLRALLDLVFIPAFHLTPADLPETDGGNILVGWDCLLLGVEMPQPEPCLGGMHALVLTGGSDVAGLGSRWPASLSTQLPGGSTVDWVTGPFSPRPRLPPSGNVAFHEHLSPSGLSPLMRQASYSLTVFGVSFFELLYFGVPTVVYSPYGDRDTQEMMALRKAEVALIARTEAEAPQLLRALMADRDLCGRLSRRAQARVDGRGGARFAHALKERIDSRWHVPT